MKYLKFLAIISIIMLLGIFIGNIPNSSAQPILTGSITKVPNNFFGVWRVTSKIRETNSPETFKEKGVDIWNLSQEDNVIVLSNPFSGASANIDIKNATKTNVEFLKTGKQNNKILTDRVIIYIDGDSFVGTDELKIETKSDIDNRVVKTQTATYNIKGERLAGQEIIK